MKPCKLIFFITLFSFSFPFIAVSQFAPQVGTQGTTAIHKDSSLIVKFNNFKTYNDSTFSLKRGWQNLNDTLLGKANIGSLDSFLSADPGTYMLSLGDKGSVTLALNDPLLNNAGPDFVVFENGFPFGKDSFFLELAFVEVSTDGKKFFRFPAISKTDTNRQIGPFGSLKAHEIHNLAGKYIAPYGVPFDLEELKDSLNNQKVTHIKLIDVGGSIQETQCSRDAQGNRINDPFPTPFPSSGFDLVMIGFVNIFTGSTELTRNEKMLVAPNPAMQSQDLAIDLPLHCKKITIRNGMGNVCYESNEPIESGFHRFRPNLLPGWYILQAQFEGNKNGFTKLIVMPQ